MILDVLFYHMYYCFICTITRLGSAASTDMVRLFLVAMIHCHVSRI